MLPSVPGFTAREVTNMYDCGPKVAVMLTVLVKAKVHWGLVPLHGTGGPLVQPANVEPEAGMAFKVKAVEGRTK
jgi:hypothetical protein